jgi:hypothetical protein
MIKNHGTVPVYVYWQITSPTGWTVDSDKYKFEESGTPKYYLTTYKQPSGEYWQPVGGSTPADTKVMIPVSGSALFSMDLLYTGSPATIDTLSLTVSFIAQDS